MDNHRELVEVKSKYAEYPTIESLTFKKGTIKQFAKWQHEMTIIYADSFLFEACLHEKIKIKCISKKVNGKTIFSKPSLTATFEIRDKNNKLMNKHTITISQINEKKINEIIESYMCLLKLAVEGCHNNGADLVRYGNLLGYNQGGKELVKHIKNTIKMNKEICERNRIYNEQ